MFFLVPFSLLIKNKVLNDSLRPQLQPQYQDFEVSTIISHNCKLHHIC